MRTNVVAVTPMRMLAAEVVDALVAMVMAPMLMIRGNLLTRSRNSAEVVVVAFELQLDRPLGMHVGERDRLRPEAEDGQVRLHRERLHAAEQVAGIALARQNRLEHFEPRLELAICLRNSGSWRALVCPTVIRP